MVNFGRAILAVCFAVIALTVCLYVAFFVEENRSFTAQDRADFAKADASIQAAAARVRAAEAHQH